MNTAPQQYIFVYQTICEPNGKSYIGVHKTSNINDGYIGCGVSKQSDANRDMVFHKAIRKYGYSSFTRNILDFFDDYQSALEEEKWLVNNQWVKQPSNYNSAVGGRGNTTDWMSNDKKNEWRLKIKKSATEWVNSGGLEKIREKSKTAKRSRLFGKQNPMYGNGNIYVERPVLKYTSQGDLVERYSSVSVAALANGTYSSSIVFCCKGIYLLAAGFVFRYEVYSEQELHFLNKNLKRGDESDYKASRVESRRISFLKKGKKNSIKVKNEHTGEIIIGITPLTKIITDKCFNTIKNRLLEHGRIGEWVKI